MPTSVRTIRPAPTSRTVESPISAITSAPRRRACPAPAVAERPPSRSVCAASVRATCQAGTRPAISVLAVASAIENSSTGAFRRTCASSGMVPGGITVVTAQRLACVSAIPSTPPAAASSALSISS